MILLFIKILKKWSQYGVILIGLLFLASCDTFKEDVRPPGANKPTVANTDNYKIVRNQSFVLHPLDNDSVFSTTTLWISEPAKGRIVQLAESDSFLYTPPVNFIGKDSLIYQLTTNGEVYSAKIRIVVTSMNDSCKTILVSDYRELLANTSVTLNPLTNDLTCDSLYLAGVIFSSNGTISLLRNNRLTYTPRQGFVGLDSTRYTACTTNGLCYQGTLKFNVKYAPSCDSIFSPQSDTITYSLGASISKNFLVSTLLANDISCTNDINPASFDIIAYPANGLLVSNGNGTLSYNPLGTSTVQFFRYNVSNINGNVLKSATVYLVGK